MKAIYVRGCHLFTLTDLEQEALMRCFTLLEDSIRIQGYCIDHRELLDRLKDEGD